MPIDPEIKATKHRDIRRSYQSWCNKSYKGVRIYTDGYIYKRLSEEYYLATATIEKIIFHRY